MRGITDCQTFTGEGHVKGLDEVYEWETKPPKSIEFPGSHGAGSCLIYSRDTVAFYEWKQGMCRWLIINLYFLPLMESYDKLETVM